MLGNSIALITLAVMLAFEAKRSEGPWSHGLYTLATVVALIGVALQPITERLPQIGIFLSSIFDMPLAWFILAMALFFVLRPFWQRPARQTVEAVSTSLVTNHPEPIPATVEKPKSISPLIPSIIGIGIDGNIEVADIDWKPPTVTEIERERVSLALVEIADLLKAPFDKFLYDGRVSCNYSKVMPKAGPQGLLTTAVSFTNQIMPFRDSVEDIFKRHDTEFQMVGIDLQHLIQLIGRILEPARNLANFLAKAPPEWRDPEYVKHPADIVARSVSILDNAKNVQSWEIRDKRLALARADDGK